jgi:tRNA nucleotidyltransferase (CCA-adding enzyme)
MEKDMNHIRIQIPRPAAKVLTRLRNLGYEAYVVGGCVRDSLLGTAPQDWDITTSANPRQIKAAFDRTIDTGIEHGTVTVRMDSESLEVTTYRVDGGYADHRHPDQVHFTKSLEEDLKRRDFTINAMAYNEQNGLIDLFGGMRDLENGIVRCVGDAGERFGEDDPLIPDTAAPVKRVEFRPRGRHLVPLD